MPSLNIYKLSISNQFTYVENEYGFYFRNMAVALYYNNCPLFWNNRKDIKTIKQHKQKFGK